VIHAFKTIRPDSRYICLDHMTFRQAKARFRTPVAMLLKKHRWPALRAPLGFAASGAGLLLLSLSIAFSLIVFLLDRVAVVTSHHSGSGKLQAESLAIR
jgi:hypothetical protein